MLQLPTIYPITNVELSGLSHADQVRALAEAGCRFLQIRDKSGSSLEIFDAVAESVSIADSFGMKIILNDRVDIAITTGLHGVHLGQDDLSPAEARELLGDDAIIGYSTHSVEQAIEAASLPIDYLAIGPIFATTTKENPDPVVGLAGIRKVRDAIGDFPLVAIGGIDITKLSHVLAAGADSAAIISALFAPGTTLADRFRALEDATAV
ncbi:MAG: thiamine phosphate synthase [Pyrinomonadaceae bacterium]